MISSARAEENLTDAAIVLHDCERQAWETQSPEAEESLRDAQARYAEAIHRSILAEGTEAGAA